MLEDSVASVYEQSSPETMINTFLEKKFNKT